MSLQATVLRRIVVDILASILQPLPYIDAEVQTQHETASTTTGDARQCGHRCPHCKGLYRDAGTGLEGKDQSGHHRRTRSTSPPGSSKKSPSLDAVRDARVTKRWNDSKLVKKSKGLNNPGSLCYQNALLQCLFNLPEFVSYLSQLHCQKKLRCKEQVKKRCVVCALKVLLDSYIDPARPDVSKTVRNSMQTVVSGVITERTGVLFEDIGLGRQSDPYEFLWFICEEMEQREDYAGADELKIRDLLSFSFAIEWKCEKCGYITSRTDDRADSGAGWGLSIGIQEPNRKMNNLPLYIYHSEFKRPNITVRCEEGACKEEKPFEGSPRTQSKKILKAPEILIIQLVRHGFEEDSAGNKKSAPAGKHFIEIKLDDPVKLQSLLNINADMPGEEPIVYQLQGVVGHAGPTLHSGHYISAVRKPNGGFCSINNEVITEDHGGRDNEWMKLSIDGTKFDPYILFYSKP